MSVLCWVLHTTQQEMKIWIERENGMKRNAPCTRNSHERLFKTYK